MNAWRLLTGCPNQAKIAAGEVCPHPPGRRWTTLTALLTSGVLTVEYRTTRRGARIYR